MRKFFNGLVMGILLSATAFFFLANRYLQKSGPSQSHLEIAQAHAAVAGATTNTNDSRQLKLTLLELRDEEVKAELKNNREIIRRKPLDIGDAAAMPDSDSNAVTEIKTRYQSDPRLSVWNISVSCDHGHVTLIGTVESVNNIGEAIAIALEPGGVRDVTSTLQLKPVTSDTQTTNQ